LVSGLVSFLISGSSFGVSFDFFFNLENKDFLFDAGLFFSISSSISGFSFSDSFGFLVFFFSFFSTVFFVVFFNVSFFFLVGVEIVSSKFSSSIPSSSFFETHFLSLFFSAPNMCFRGSFELRRFWFFSITIILKRIGLRLL